MSDRIEETVEEGIDPLAIVLAREAGGGAIVEVSQLWGDAWLGTRRFPKPGRAVTIGSSDDGADFLVPGVSGRELVTWNGGRAFVRVDAGWDGFVDTGGQRARLADVGEADGAGRIVALEGDRRVVVEVGGMVFVVQRVAPGKKAVTSLGEGFDWAFASIATAVGMAGLLFGALVHFLPPSPESSLYEDPQDIIEAYMYQPQAEPVKAAPAGEKAKGPEGVVGDREAKLKKAKGPKRKADRDREVVDVAGALGAWQDEGIASALDGGFSPGIAAGVGGLIGPKGAQYGSGGLAARGTGVGGGGHAEGMGGLALSGNGPGAGGSCGDCGMGGKGEGALNLPGGETIVGGYDKSLVDEVVKRHLSKIRYCYQRELQRNPEIGGKVVVRFTIGKDGSVSSASTKSSSVGNDAVTSCIEQKFMGMSFPAPKAGIVIVSYPFLFAPGASK